MSDPRRRVPALSFFASGQGRAVESLLPEGPFEIRHSGHGSDVGDVLHVDPRLVEYLFRYHCGLFKIRYICIEARSAGMNHPGQPSRMTGPGESGHDTAGGASIRSGSVAPGPQPVETAQATTRNRAAKHRGSVEGSPYFFTSSPRRYLSRGSFSGAIFFPPLLVVGRMAISNHVRTASVFPFSIRHTTLIALSR